MSNLACEHHFGDLDSSQRRRPSASMHHHSSIQLLKRNRKGMMSWIQEMSINERNKMIKKMLVKEGVNLEKSILAMKSRLFQRFTMK